jgi:pimeloyl-ACP methyl ester carboxylesterase
VVIGKSLASAAAGLVAERELPAVWLTPLLDQAVVRDGLARVTRPTLLVGGSADPTWNGARVRGSPIEVLELPGLDHSLRSPGDPSAFLEALATVTRAISELLETLERST